MKIKDLQLGDMVEVNVCEGTKNWCGGNFIQDSGTATIVGIDLGFADRPLLLGWKDGDAPLTKTLMGFPGRKHIAYLDGYNFEIDQTPWIHFLWVEESDVLRKIASGNNSQAVAMIKKAYPNGICPCGLNQSMCEYHK